jgi:serine/threonine protein phosphatase PrpC
MEFSIHDFMSMPGDKVNEDIAYAEDTYGWVIDGATGLNKINFTGSSGDVYWFVNEWNSYLKENILDKSRDIKEIISEGLDCISDKFNEVSALKHPNKVDLPSASIALIRINNNKVEYFLLGDCTLIVQDNNGKPTIIKQTLLDKLDNIAKDEMRKLIVNEGISFTEARQKINSLLIKHRLLKNTPEGYWTLGFDKNAVENSICGCFDFAECKKALLMSDGFSAIFDNYNCVDSDNIISIIEKQGLHQIYKTIRLIEEDDAEVIKFSRFKKSDDASAIIFS